MTELGELSDEYGPEAVVLLREPRAGYEAIVVVDCTSAGPAIGGVRMAPDVTAEEVARLARAMTLKNAAAGLAHGGAKAGIVADPGQPPAAKEAVVRWFARAIRDRTDYIPGPDMGTDERAMAWVLDEIGRCVGLPRVLGGIPLDEIGATGYGLAACARALGDAGVLRLEGARVAVQGFGAVGRHAARFLRDLGMAIVAVADSSGAIADPEGLDVDALCEWKAGGGHVREFGGVDAIERDAVVAVDCDVFVPAARPDVLRADNADALRAAVVLPGANIPATAEAEQLLHDRGVFVMPDFVANAGGVICAAVEYHGGTQAQALATIDERIRANTAEVVALARQDSVAPREAAERLARRRAEEARSYRRTF
jgi:glutamate dehydrogenase (NAD(P)+)